MMSANCEGDRPGAGNWLVAVREDKALTISDEAYDNALRLNFQSRQILLISYSLMHL